MAWDVVCGDCRDVMRKMEADSVDSIVTDPPYGLSFMGKGWDKGVPGVEFWEEALRVAKPGAYLLAFGGTRMVHRLAVAIEDAGWDIRDRIHWMYGSGFPKSHNVSLGIDKHFGGKNRGRAIPVASTFQASDINETNKLTSNKVDSYDAVHPEAQKWSGWGTALKPAVEPIIMARKPLIGTVAANVLKYGTGGVNVDGCRVGDEVFTINTWDNGAKPFGDGAGSPYTGREQLGRWPANLIHDGSDEATAGMGDAARYFYSAKASKRDRDEGICGNGRFSPTMGNGIGGKEHDPETASEKKNHHPTVKPTDLMAYLCRLVTPQSGLVLDPFNGSGSTGRAAIREGFSYLGIEIDPEYVEIAKSRIKAESEKYALFQ